MEFSNPIMEGLKAYSMVNQIADQKEDREARREEREYQKRLRPIQERIQTKQLESAEKDLEDKETRGKLNAAKYILATTPPGVDPFSRLNDEQKKLFQPLIDNDPMVQGYLKDPALRKQHDDGLKLIEQGMDNTQGPPNIQKVIQGLNMSRPDLLQGTADDGKPALSKQITNVYLSEDGKSFAAELEVTRQDGSKYMAPLTEGRDASPDAKIKWIPIADVSNDIRVQRGMLDYVNARLVEAGDTSPITQMAEEAKETRKLKSDMGMKAYESGLRREETKEKEGLEHTNRIELEKLKGSIQKNLESLKKRLGANNDKLPADAQMIEYYVSTGIASDRKQAADMVKLSKSNPVELIAKLVTEAEKGQEFLPANQRKSQGELVKDAQSLVFGLHEQWLGRNAKPAGGKLQAASSHGDNRPDFDSFFK